MAIVPSLQAPTLGNRPDEPKAMTRIGCWLLCTFSSIGRASALHAEGYRFETYRVHQEWAINSLK